MGFYAGGLAGPKKTRYRQAKTRGKFFFGFDNKIPYILGENGAR